MQKNNYLLTIDVGIKNLAYCISKYNNEENKDISLLDRINIIDWNILDVSYKALYCKEVKNKRAICNCISKYYSLKDSTKSHSDSENLIGYCKTHVKLIQKNNKIDKKNQIKLYKISLNPIYKENFNTQMERLFIILEKFYSNIIEKPYNIENGELQYINNLKIYIENQPVLKNPIMKTISIGIFSFFILKKINNSNIINSINFINASVKTKDDFIKKISQLIDIRSSISMLKDYKNRKNFTIDIANQIIHKLQNNINNVISTSKYIINKKKDDFADTLIYVIYVIIYLL